MQVRVLLYVEPTGGGVGVSRLELKIPPDVVWVLVAGLMWLASLRTPKLDLPSPIRIGLAVVLTVVGIWFMVSARASLEKANTTWRPMSPGQTKSLVSSGVYRASRNPIYLGMLLVMLGFAVALSSLAALSGVVCLRSLHRPLPSQPEERALSSVLGDEYLDYRARVRR